MLRFQKIGSDSEIHIVNDLVFKTEVSKDSFLIINFDMIQMQKTYKGSVVITMNKILNSNPYEIYILSSDSEIKTQSDYIKKVLTQVIKL